MSNRKDLRLDIDNDLIIENGDFDIELSDPQHIRDVLETGLGSFKQYPEIGCFVSSMLNGCFDLKEKAKIRQQLKLDGYESVVLNITDDGKIQIKI